MKRIFATLAVISIFFVIFIFPVSAVSSSVSYPVNEPAVWVSIEFYSASSGTRYYLYSLPYFKSIEIRWSGAEDGSNLRSLDFVDAETGVYTGFTCYSVDGSFFYKSNFQLFDESFSPVSISFGSTTGDVNFQPRSQFPSVSHPVYFTGMTDPDAPVNPSLPDNSGSVGDLDDIENNVIGSVNGSTDSIVNDIHSGGLTAITTFVAGFTVVSSILTGLLSHSFFGGLAYVSLAIGVFASIVGIASAAVSSYRHRSAENTPRKF